MVEMECYHVMSESEILQKLNKDNTDNQPSKGTRNPKEQAMMVWEILDETLEEQDEDYTIGIIKIQFDLRIS